MNIRSMMDQTTPTKWMLYKKAGCMPINKDGETFPMNKNNVERVSTMQKRVNGTVIYVKFNPDKQVAKLATPDGKGGMDTLVVPYRSLMGVLRVK